MTARVTALNTSCGENVTADILMHLPLPETHSSTWSLHMTAVLVCLNGACTCSSKNIHTFLCLGRAVQVGYPMASPSVRWRMQSPQPLEAICVRKQTAIGINAQPDWHPEIICR